MPRSDFEGPQGVAGSISVKPLDPASPGTTPYIIETKNPFEVLVEWEIHGPTAPFVGGEWQLRLFIDPVDGLASTQGQLGPAALVPLGSPPSPPSPRPYSHTFQFGRNTVTKGVYHMTAVLTYDNGGAQLEMAAFAEIPFIEFYDV